MGDETTNTGSLGTFSGFGTFGPDSQTPSFTEPTQGYTPSFNFVGGDPTINSGQYGSPTGLGDLFGAPDPNTGMSFGIDPNGNPVSPPAANNTNQVNWTDLWNKYKKYFQFGAGMLARTNPAVATAYGLYNIFNSPRGALAGQAGSTLGSVVGGAINPALSGVGGAIGGQMAQGAAAKAEGQYGQATGPVGSQGSSSAMDYGALGAGLGQIWNRYGAAKEYGNQGKQLASLYGPDSAYAQQLRQSLARQDASRGRRSQVGTREVELQARLADLASRNAPQLQQLTKAKSDEKNKMYTDLYSFGRGLYDLM